MKTTTFLEKSGQLLLGKLAMVLSALLSSTFFARGLGALGYGNLTLGLSIVSIFGSLFRLGFNSSTRHFVAKYYKKNKDKAIHILKFLLKWEIICAFFLGLTLFLASGWLSKVYQSKDLSPVLKILALGFTFSFMEGTVLSTFRGLKEMILVGYRKVIWSILKLLPIMLAIFGFGLISVSLGYTGALMLTSVFSIYLLTNQIDLFQKNYSVFNKKRVLKYSLLSYGSGVLNLGLFKATIIASGLLSVANVGFLHIGKRLSKMIVFLAAPLSNVLFPTISDLWHREKERAKVLFKRITRYRIFLSIPFVILIFLFGRSGIRYIYGKEFLPAFKVLAIMSIIYLSNGLLGSFSPLVMGSENVDINLKSKVISVVLNLSLAFLLIPTFGLMGASIALTIGIVSGNIWQAYKINKDVKIEYPSFEILRALISGLIAGTVSYLVYYLLHFGIWEFIPILLIFTVTYFFILFLLGGFRDFEIDFMKRFLRQKRYLHYLGLE